MYRNNILLLYVMKSKTENDTCKFYIVNVRILKIRAHRKYKEYWDDYHFIGTFP